MVDYMSYMQPQRRRSGVSDIMNIMAFKENKRKNQLLQELKDAKNTPEEDDANFEKAKYKAGMVIKAVDAEKKLPGSGALIAKMAGIEGWDFDGSNVTMVGPKKNTISGHADNVKELSRLFFEGNLDAAEQYMKNPDNNLLIQPPALPPTPGNMMELLTREVSNLPEDQRTPDNIIALMNDLKAVGSGATPEYAFLQSNKGIVAGDKRTGKVELAKDENNQPFLSVSADPNILRDKEKVKKEVAAAADKEKKYPKVRDSLTTLKRKSGTVNSSIDKAMELIAPHTAGMGAWMKIIPATPQKTLHELLNTIRANIGFDALQEMRANSPTGGALGQVSEMENKLLQSVQGSLSQELSPKELAENLKTIKENYASMLEETGRSFITDFNEFIPAQEAPGRSGNASMTADEYLKNNKLKGQ